MIPVSLFVRLWVEIPLCSGIFGSTGVSLFVRLWVEIWKQNSMSQLPTCQPLREAVSWNTQQIHGNMKKEVSLFVRLWVEISPTHWYPEHYRSSASSWGCELKYDLREDCVDGESVSLFVRLWVEIFETLHSPTVHPGQPLREAVSWNIEIGSIQNSFLVSLFVRLWVEIDRKQQKRWNVWVSLFVRLWVEMSLTMPQICLRALSASSWGCELKYPLRGRLVLPFRSASSWGCELKYYCTT